MKTNTEMAEIKRRLDVIEKRLGIVHPEKHRLLCDCPDCERWRDDLDYSDDIPREGLLEDGDAE